MRSSRATILKVIVGVRRRWDDRFASFPGRAARTVPGYGFDDAEIDTELDTMYGTDKEEDFGVLGRTLLRRYPDKVSYKQPTTAFTVQSILEGMEHSIDFSERSHAMFRQVLNQAGQLRAFQHASRDVFLKQINTLHQTSGGDNPVKQNGAVDKKMAPGRVELVRSPLCIQGQVLAPPTNHTIEDGVRRNRCHV